MTGTKIKDCELVVMDGTDVEIVYWVAEMLSSIIPMNGVIITHPIGHDHLEKIAMKFRAVDEDFVHIQKTIDAIHPGLCIYNPPMHV